MQVISTVAVDDEYGPARARHGVRHGMADPVAADSRLHIVGSGAGGGFPSGNGPAAAGRPAGTIAKALALGAASSSCSYAAVAIARALFRKGADFTAAMAFEMASTNLVVELAIIMLVFLGWQFTLAEFVGAPIMVGCWLSCFDRFSTARLLDEAKAAGRQGPDRPDGRPCRNGYVGQGRAARFGSGSRPNRVLPRSAIIS